MFNQLDLEAEIEGTPGYFGTNSQTNSLKFKYLFLDESQSLWFFQILDTVPSLLRRTVKLNEMQSILSANCTSNQNNWGSK